tara:strand:- start:1120 stop:1329 length:210 start_codon:yes stop_codon:yes gene_type:complete
MDNENEPMNQKEAAGFVVVLLFAAILLYFILGGDPEDIDKAIEQTNQIVDTVERVSDQADEIGFKLGVT